MAIKLSHGYAILERTWKSGDVVDLDLPMPARRVMANAKVKADVGRVALERGPIVFCAEWMDNPNGKVRNLILPNDQALTADYEPALLNGVEILKGKAVSISRVQDGSSVKTQQDFEAIPYFAWANRGKGEMTVWLADSEANAIPPHKSLQDFMGETGAFRRGSIHYRGGGEKLFPTMRPIIVPRIIPATKSENQWMVMDTPMPI